MATSIGWWRCDAAARRLMPVTKREYSRLYLDLVDDPMFADIYADDATFGTWAKLLMIAESSWPSSAALPHGVSPSRLRRLTDAGLIVVAGVRFRVRGMDKEREARSQRGKAGADARWSDEPPPMDANAPDARMPTHSDRNATAMPPHSGNHDSGMPSKDEQSKDEQSKAEKATLSPQAQPRRNGSPTKEEPRLTRTQLDSWDSFSAPQWQPFKEAWLSRGLRFAPAGGPDDDDTSQRGLLWQIADARPHDLGRWTREAKGRTSREVIDYVLTQWHEIRVDVAAGEAELAEQKVTRRTEGPTHIGDVVGRLQSPLPGRPA